MQKVKRKKEGVKSEQEEIKIEGGRKEEFNKDEYVRK